MALAILGTLFGIPARIITAQGSKPFTAEKNGRFHLGKPAQIGGRTLGAGMYRVQHFEANGEHVVFCKVEMGYRATWASRNSARKSFA